LRVYIPPYQKETGRADYALQIMKVQFDFFEDLFGMDYSLPKCGTDFQLLILISTKVQFAVFALLLVYLPGCLGQETAK